MKASSPGDQQGLALIVVVFTMAIAVIIAASVAKQQNLFVKRSTNLFINEQALQIAYGAESFAKKVLFQDFEQDKEDKKFTDHETETWSEYAAALSVDVGSVELQLDDLQGRLNLNNLVDRDGKVNTEYLKKVQSLLDNLGIENINAEKLVDWIDEDVDSYEYKGAEDDVYLLKEPPYRAANSWFSHVSELLLIDGLTYEEYAVLLPHVATLPPGTSGININTCTKEVLMTISEKLTAENAETVIEKRKEDPFDSVEDMFKLPELSGIPIPKSGLTVNTHYFQASIKVTIGDRVSRLTSTIHRDEEGEFTVIARDQGQKYIITKEKIVL